MSYFLENYLLKSTRLLLLVTSAVSKVVLFTSDLGMIFKKAYIQNICKNLKRTSYENFYDYSKLLHLLELMPSMSVSANVKASFSR